MSDLPRLLIVDNSRVVRATLAKHLNDRYAIREEANGESAWQTLVLDPSIVAVICGIQMPKLDGFGLLERLRGNRLHRLSEMPFLLIVSDTESEEGRNRARSLGASDCITKLMSRGEILERVALLVEKAEAHRNDLADPEPVGRLLPQTGADADPAEGGAGGEGNLVPEKLAVEPRLLSRREIEARIEEALAYSDDRSEAVSVLVLEVRNFDQLNQAFGLDMAEKICGRFARLLLGKIRDCDSIGYYSPERCVIVSRGANLTQCSGFAQRVRSSMATAQITVRGQGVKLAIEAGAASVPEDGALGGEDLLALAIRRLGSAATADPGELALGKALPSLAEAAAFLANEPRVLAAHLGALGLQFFPLLAALDRELGLTLPLVDIENKLKDRARLEEQGK